MSATFKPTDEQVHVMDLFRTGESLKVAAYAGAGKTSTLKLLPELAEFRDNPMGHYVAFNRAIVDDGRKSFPSDRVTCSTAHALAVRSPIGAQLRHALNRKRLYSRDLARALGTSKLAVVIGADQTAYLAPDKVAALVHKMVMRYCQTADQVPATPGDWARYAPRLDGIEGANHWALAREVAAWAPKLWRDLCSPTGQLMSKHNGFSVILKLWQLSKPNLCTGYVMFDEAQDADPVMLDVVQHQASFGTQIVFVGDQHQAIYEWRGAVNAMRDAPAVHTARLTQSFRFGSAVADVANLFLGLLGETEPLRGFDQINSRVDRLDTPDVVLSRTNGALVARALELFDQGRRPAIVGGANDVVQFARAAVRIQAGLPHDYEDLLAFSTWAQVQDFADTDDGEDLALLVDLVDRYGAVEIERALANCADERNADVILSTAHKAKGREWHNVQIASDFPSLDPEARRPITEPELRLGYVACTRAQRVLDITRWPTLVEALADARDDAQTIVAATAPIALGPVTTVTEAVAALAATADMTYPELAANVEVLLDAEAIVFGAGHPAFPPADEPQDAPQQTFASIVADTAQDAVAPAEDADPVTLDHHVIPGQIPDGTVVKLVGSKLPCCHKGAGIKKPVIGRVVKVTCSCGNGDAKRWVGRIVPARGVTEMLGGTPVGKIEWARQGANPAQPTLVA